MPSNNKDFALYCCDLLAGIGPCVTKRMFGGWGISLDGMNVGMMTDLGQGDKLWLKATDESAATFRAAGCAQFIYHMKGQPKGMNYFNPPEEAMESAPLMLPWARLALQAAVEAASKKTVKSTIKKPARKLPAKKPKKPL